MEDNRRRQKDYFRKRTRVSPRAYILLVVVIVLILYLIFSSFGGETRTITRYLESTNKVITKSNEVASGFNGLKKNVAKASRPELKKKLQEYAQENQRLTKEGNSIKAPETMKQGHTLFVLALELRAKGLDDYGPALFNALKDTDLEVASAQVAKALKDLSLSDQAYRMFASRAKESSEKAGVTVQIAKSQFLKEEAAYEKISLIPYLQNLKGIKNLEESHGLNMVNISVNPKQTNFLKTRKLAVLPRSNKFTVTAVVENQGNQIEFNLPVIATLKSSEKVKEQKEEIRIVSIEPREKKTVTFSRLKPARGKDVINLLTVTAGPVPKEKNTKNNSTEYKFMVAESQD